MKKKLSILPSRGRKPHWSVLAPGTAYENVHKLDHLMSLLQAQYQFAEVVTVSTVERVPGKDKFDKTL